MIEIVKIHHEKTETGDLLRSASDLTIISHIVSDRDQRPCQNCHLPCACSQSPSCACSCSISCRHLARKLSSEPEEFPLESRIVPLVYALNSLRVVTPCWSCEGHNDSADQLIKLPSVWFNTSSQGLPRLLVEHCGQLYGDRETYYRWGIEVLGLGDVMQTTYSLRPNLSLLDDANLSHLHKDIVVLAEGLFEGVKAAARAHLPELMESKH